MIDESDVRKIIAEVQATSCRLRQRIRVRELAATHRLGQVRRLRMLEEQKAWKREAGFDHIDTAAEMSAQRFRTNLVSEFFYGEMFNPRWFYTPNESTLEIKVDVKQLRMEIVISQPAPPLQCDPSPRRLPAVDTGSEEPGTPRRSPAIGTGSHEPGASRAETQPTEREENCSSSNESQCGCFLELQRHKLEAGVYYVSIRRRYGNDEATTSTVQADTRKEFAGLPIGRQKRETASTEQSKQFEPGGWQIN